MFPNETTSTFQVTSEQFPLLFDYVSNVSYDTQEKTLSLTLPLLTMRKWIILTVSALSVFAGIFLLRSIYSLVRDFEDALSDDY